MNSNKHETHILSDIADITMGQSPKGESCNSDGNGVPLLNGPTEFGDNHPYPTQFTVDAKKWSKKGDLLFCVRGSTTGRMNWSDQNYAIGRGIAAISPKHLNSDRFIKALIEMKLPELLKMATGSTFPNVSRNMLTDMIIEIPSQNEITKINNLLKNIEDKIIVNNQINKNLQALSHLLFKHWFVDFEFPNEEALPYKSSGGEMVDSELGMIPKGWEVSSLDKIADYLNGLAMQKYRPKSDKYIPVIKIKEMRNGFSDNTEKADVNIPKQYIVHDGDILFSWSGTLDVVIWCNGIGGLNQHLYKVTSDKYPKWFYYLWTLHHLEQFKLIAATKATTMGHIKKEDLSKANVLIPSENELNEFDKIIEPIIEHHIALSVENRKLADLRDTFLPKLMNGEIDLSNIEINQ